MPIYEGFNVTASDREGKKYKAVAEDGSEVHLGLRAIALKLALMLAIITVREAVAFLRLVDLQIGGRGSCGVARAKGQ